MTHDRLFFKFTAELGDRELLTNRVRVREGARGERQSMAAVVQFAMSVSDQLHVDPLFYFFSAN